VLVAGLGSSSRADWDIKDGHKMHDPQLPDPTGWDVRFTPLMLADDWLCTQTGPIHDIHLWFSWQRDYQWPIESVRVSIFGDVPDPDGSGPLYSHPGLELWSQDFSPSELIIRFYDYSPLGQGFYDPSGPGVWSAPDHFVYYQMNIKGITTPFFQQVGSIYWLGVRVNLLPGVPPNYSAGWKTSLNHFSDDAVWWDEQGGLWRELRDPLTGASLDLAFVVVPEPSSVALALAGASLWLLVLLRRR